MQLWVSVSQLLQGVVVWKVNLFGFCLLIGQIKLFEDITLGSFFSLNNKQFIRQNY